VPDGISSRSSKDKKRGACGLKTRKSKEKIEGSSEVTVLLANSTDRFLPCGATMIEGVTKTSRSTRTNTSNGEDTSQKWPAGSEEQGGGGGGVYEPSCRDKGGGRGEKAKLDGGTLISFPKVVENEWERRRTIKKKNGEHVGMGSAGPRGYH